MTKTLNESFSDMLAEVSRNSPKRVDHLQGVELFLRFVELRTKVKEKEALLDKAGLDASCYADGYYAMLRCMMHMAFTPEQVGWIDWWLYERVDKVVTFLDGRPEVRLDTPEQLWAFIHEGAACVAAQRKLEGEVSQPTEQGQHG